MRRLGPHFLSGLVLLFFSSTHSVALDYVRTAFELPETDRRTLVLKNMITAIMEATRNDFGDYQVTSKSKFLRRRVIEAMETGKVNLFFAPFDKDLVNRFYALPVLLESDILSFRIPIIAKKNVEKFNSISSVEDLRAMKVGAVRGWTIAKYFRQSGFEVVETNNRDSLFSMLAAGRIDFVPAGIYDVREDLDHLQSKHPNISLQSGLKLQIPYLPYLYVSKVYPRMLARFEAGIDRTIVDGTLLSIVKAAFQPELELVDLERRRTLFLGIEKQSRLSTDSNPQ